MFIIADFTALCLKILPRQRTQAAPPKPTREHAHRNHASICSGPAPGFPCLARGSTSEHEEMANKAGDFESELVRASEESQEAHADLARPLLSCPQT